MAREFFLLKYKHVFLELFETFFIKKALITLESR
jgi:hypothetical protein